MTTGEKAMSAVYAETHETNVLMPILSRLLLMADSYRRGGAPRQASEMYFELAERNADSVEGWQARDRLVEIAEEYEKQSLPRQARGIYERLLEAEEEKSC
jgi:hypothetical protein